MDFSQNTFSLTLPESIMKLGYDLSHFVLSSHSEDLLSNTLINHTERCFLGYSKLPAHNKQGCNEIHYLNGDSENVREMRQNVIRLLTNHQVPESYLLGLQFLEHNGCSWDWFEHNLPLKLYKDLSMNAWLDTMCYICKMDTIDMYCFLDSHFAVLDFICFRNFVKKASFFSISVEHLYFQVNIFHSQQIIKLIDIVSRFDTPLQIMFNVGDSLLDAETQDYIRKFLINASYKMHLLETTNFKKKYILLTHRYNTSHVPHRKYT